MSDETFRRMASQRVRELEAQIAEAIAERDRLRAALITWRNAFETGRHEPLHIAYEAGNAALGVPVEQSAREGDLVRAYRTTKGQQP